MRDRIYRLSQNKPTHNKAIITTLIVLINLLTKGLPWQIFSYEDPCAFEKCAELTIFGGHTILNLVFWLLIIFLFSQFFQDVPQQTSTQNTLKTFYGYFFASCILIIYGSLVFLTMHEYVPANTLSKELTLENRALTYTFEL